MEFDQLDLQKALKILDALPQTIKELLSKHEIKKEELEPTLRKKPTPKKAPQTTVTPCKDLVVSAPKDNTYTTYHNNTNKVNLGKLSEREANLLFAIFQKLKDQGNTLIRFEPQDLKRMLNIDISNERLSEVVIKLWDSIKTADFWKVRDIIANGRECVSEKNYMLFQICEIVSDKETREFLYMDIQLNTGCQYLLNNLGMGGQYTSFKLLEFQRVRGKYKATSPLVLRGKPLKPLIKHAIIKNNSP